MTPLTGAINVDNALLAAEAALALGLEPAEVAAALARVARCPGRLQVIAAAPAGPGPVRRARAERPPFTVLVDYAHTPAGLEVVLARGAAPGRDRRAGAGGVRVRGNRDRAKRPENGRARPRLSDVAVLTSDNPRDEDPLRHHRRGRWPAWSASRRHGGFVVEPDRRRAIRRALEEARPGDVVVIAGKGHETYQEIAGRACPSTTSPRRAARSRPALPVRTDHVRTPAGRPPAPRPEG